MDNLAMLVFLNRNRKKLPTCVQKIMFQDDFNSMEEELEEVEEFLAENGEI
jgi:hypothetical protein